MLMMPPAEGALWRESADEIVAKDTTPDAFDGPVRADLLPAFRCYAGVRLVRAGRGREGRAWFTAGVLEEEHGQFFNAFVSGFLGRHAGRLVTPEVVFADPKPFVHFAGVPAIAGSRRALLDQCAESLPRLDHPLRIVDLGCGDGGLIVALVKHLQEAGKVGDVGEIRLVDTSPAMLELAGRTVSEAFTADVVRPVHDTIAGAVDAMDGRFDVAFSSLAYHHMPVEQKRTCHGRLKQSADHVVIFEIDADHDTPEVDSPELVLSVYRSYGRVIDMVYEHDAPVEVAQACVDRFLMGEAISLLTQPRGVRNRAPYAAHPVGRPVRRGVGAREDLLAPLHLLRRQLHRPVHLALRPELSRAGHCVRLTRRPPRPWCSGPWRPRRPRAGRRVGPGGRRG